jgi:hypothetical protein
MMKTGQVEKTSDRQYEVEERRYRTLESASLRLQKEAKGYLDSLRAMTASQMRIAETIDAFYGDSGATDGVSRSYKQAVEDLDAETVKALDGPYRCVPSDLRGFAWDHEKGTEDKEELRQIEWEMKRGAQDSFAGLMRVDLNAHGELMDFIYRTTVLEPINRFCAYFPDINECKWRKLLRIRVDGLLTGIAGIKKRNHKMLDYDSMRSKVKRLTEKPDKDPAKLPRTEKEQEMVSPPDFLYDYSPISSPSVSRQGSVSVSAKTNSDLGVPSPPKALNGIRQRFGLGPEEGELDTGTIEEDDDLKSLPSQGRRSRRTLLGRTTSILSNYSALDSPPLGADSIDGVSPKKENKSATPASPTIIKRSRVEDPSHSRSPTSMTRLVDHQYPSSTYSFQSSSTLNPAASFRDSASTRGVTWPRQSCVSSSYSTPWFEPSELEDIMAPLRLDFMRKQADKLEQAKVAYDQLNEQLMSELPQLIDLRYVYPAD